MTYPSLETAGLNGRTVALTPMDLDRHGDALWAAIGAQDDLWTYIPGGPFPTRKTFEDWISERHNRPGYDILAVVDRKDRKAAGVMVIPQSDEIMGVSEIGMVYGRSLSGATAGAEAVYLLTDHILGAGGYRRLEWRTNPDNHASCRAAERYGFSFEGRLRQTYWMKDRNWDTNVYSILDREWPRLRARFLNWLDPDNFEADGRQKRALREFG